MLWQSRVNYPKSANSVDDTHTKQKVEHTKSFTQHFNSLDQDIKFTSEGVSVLDTLTCKQADGSVKVKVFRKATHTDQYLNFQSYQPLQHKLAVVRALCHRANTIISTEKDKEEENRHITSTLRECGYPKWAIEQALKPEKPSCSRTEPASGLSPQSVAVPYIKGVAGKTQRIFKSAGVRSYLCPAQKIKQILSRPKDPIPPQDACGVVYHIKCDGGEANDESPCSESYMYIGETERSLRSRFLEHRRSSSIH